MVIVETVAVAMDGYLVVNHQNHDMTNVIMVGIVANHQNQASRKVRVVRMDHGVAMVGILGISWIG